MGSLEKRVVTARQYAGLTQPQLAERIGVSRRTIVNYEKDASKASVITVQRIATVCKVNEVWLLIGRGEMITNQLPPKENDSNITIIEHQGLVTRFKDSKKAKELNEDLLVLEEVDTEGFNEVHDIVKMKIRRKGIQKKTSLSKKKKA